jgi:hypothetical protein
MPAMITQQTTPVPEMPPVGLPESQYARLIHRADKTGDVHGRESYKVAQYITLALDPHLRWPQKLRYFEHALHRHCNPPPLPDETVWLFYRNLCSLVRDYCGQEALRLASKEDDVYAKWVAMGCTQERIDSSAREFFNELLGEGLKCPEHFHEEDWQALQVFRKQWDRTAV